MNPSSIVNRRVWDLVAAAFGYLLILAALWTEGQTARLLFWAATAWIVAASLGGKRSWRELGLAAGAPQVWLATLGAAAVAGAVMVALAAGAGTLHGLFGQRRPLLHVLGYLLWTLEQQFIAQSFFYVRLEALSGSPRRAVLGTAILFSLAHLPSSVLVPVTFLGGWLLSEIFRRYRTIYPLALAQGLIGLAIAVSFPDALQRHMRVGIGYLRYR